MQSLPIKTVKIGGFLKKLAKKGHNLWKSPTFYAKKCLHYACGMLLLNSNR